MNHEFISTQKRMQTCRINVLSAAISAALLSSAGGVWAQQGDSVIEEVIVTGSLIPRTEGFTAASPVTVITADDLAAQGTINMGEVVMNSVFNLGSGIANTTQGTSDNSTSFNLRGLGSSATLTLVDGKRVPTDNVQILLPSIAIQRIDILKDGAAALYGTDAVSGVVNYLPYKTYTGFEITAYHEEADSSQGPDNYRNGQLEFLAGSELGNGVNFVLAGSHRDQGHLKRIDRADNNLAGLNQSPNSNPGSFLVPGRDDDGQLLGSTTRLADPSCGETRTDPSILGANPYGFFVRSSLLDGQR